MAELEKTIEDKLIEQLTTGKSQWTYRPDLHTEEELWANLRSILERGNKAVLDGKPLTDQEFEQVKNQLSFATFYDAAKWIAGENGIAHVYVQRDTETVQLTALKRDDIAGGSSVYEVINQYRALKDDEEDIHSQNRRFDVSLLINGIPLIHIELKNRQHSYLDGFRQIRKYIREGKFTGIFSAVQMFVVSNAVDTKYFAAASEEELNEDEALAKFQAENPLYALLQPSYTQQGPAQTARVGIAQVKDTANINRMLAETANIFPRTLKLAWSVKPQNYGGETEFLELVALKMSRDNKCALGGEVITDARQDYGQNNQVEVTLQMNSEGAKAWKRLTGENIGKQVAIVLDNYVYSFPVVNDEIPNGRSSISGGGMQIEEAQDLANILKAGKLPAPARILEEQVVGPSLGQESVRKGMWSMVFAFLLVLIYMVFFYKKAGLVADVALIVNVFFLFGVLACLGSVLTLPGIAGIVLTLGMAVDSNVIIFERIKEELRGGKALRAAIDAGYKNAYSAIIDGNVTTLITGIVLIILGTGPVHSFAVTLCIGILTSLFTSIFISRLIFTRMLDKEKEISFTTKFTENFLKDTHFDFIKFRKTAYIIALVMIVISVGSLAFKGLNLGIDFKGGRNYIVRFDQDVKVDQVREALSAVNVEGWETPEVKTYGPNGQVKITTKYKIEDNNPEVDSEIQGILYQGLNSLFSQKLSAEQFSSEDETIGVLSTQKVGATIASDVKRKSIWAIAVSLVLMFAYIAIRFRRWQYGLSALAALTHDTVIMLGMYSLFFNILPFTMEVDQAFIAAVLTIIGYSINATVVIFDRVRENTNLHPKATWRENINNAVNSTLTRSFNTSGSTFVVLLAIFFFGGDTIRGFIFALLVGILAGTFSSVFLSSPIAYNLLKGHKQEKALAEAEENNKKK